MSTGYSWEGIRQVRATLLGARHVPERLCGDRIYLGRYIKCSTFTLFNHREVVDILQFCQRSAPVSLGVSDSYVTLVDTCCQRVQCVTLTLAVTTAVQTWCPCPVTLTYHSSRLIVLHVAIAVSVLGATVDWV